jgi:hypothetical protein
MTFFNKMNGWMMTLPTTNLFIFPQKERNSLFAGNWLAQEKR